MALLRDDLLNPIPGANPSGENLRYDPVYDKIKDARQEDTDDAPQGDWQRAPKKADFAAVVKLAGEALAKRSKDLQLVAWLGEAMLRRESFAALPECIALFQQVQERFWDTCYPELEDGSPEFRRTSQEWFASRCDYILRRLPLTTSKLNRIQYLESRTIPSEDDAKEDEKKFAQREEALSQNKLTPEEWDEGFRATPKMFYESLVSSLNASLEATGMLDKFCDEKYGMEGPNFAKLRSVLEEVKLTANTFLAEKGGPDRAAEEIEQEASSDIEDIRAVAVSSGGAAAAPARAKSSGPWSEPSSPEVALAMVARIADFLRKHDASLVAPYSLVRALRWGELRFQGEGLDESFLASPSTEVRQELRRLHREGLWEELLNAVEGAMTTPCGRGWLDLQRYAWEGCYNLSYSAAAKTICTETRALLGDYPDLPAANLNDGTAAADKQTLEWIADYVQPSRSETEQTVAEAVYPDEDQNGNENGEADYFDVAMQLARAGRLSESIDGFSREAARESSGRDRFRRQLQLAQLCLATQHFAMAYPILQGLAEEIERRNLFDWEDQGLLSQVLAMLVQCIDRTTRNQEERARVFSLLCRFGPAAALQLEKS